MRNGGTYAEEIVANADAVVPIPDAMDYVTAAAGFPVAYGTSHFGLTHRGNLKAGETLLVLGAAGGVGLSAVEIGKQMGARVIAAAGGPEKLEIARGRGADELIDYKTESIRDRVRELTGGLGADVVYDPVGGDAFDQAIRAVNWEARMLIIGFASGRLQQVPANPRPREEHLGDRCRLGRPRPSATRCSVSRDLRRAARLVGRRPRLHPYVAGNPSLAQDRRGDGSAPPRAASPGRSCWKV